MLQCGTDEQLKIELLSQWKLEAEFRNTDAYTSADSTTDTCASLQQIHTSDSQYGNCKDVKLGEPSKLFLRCALNPTQLRNKHCFVNVLRTLCFTTLLKIASIQTDSSAQNKATSSEQL